MGFNCGVSWKSPETIKLMLSLSLPNKRFTNVTKAASYLLMSNQVRTSQPPSLCLSVSAQFLEMRKHRYPSRLSFQCQGRLFAPTWRSLASSSPSDIKLQRHVNSLTGLTNSPLPPPSLLPPVVKVQFKQTLTHTLINTHTHTHTALSLSPAPVA